MNVPSRVVARRIGATRRVLSSWVLEEDPSPPRKHNNAATVADLRRIFEENGDIESFTPEDPLDGPARNTLLGETSMVRLRTGKQDLDTAVMTTPNYAESEAMTVTGSDWVYRPSLDRADRSYGSHYTERQARELSAMTSEHRVRQLRQNVVEDIQAEHAQLRERLYGEFLQSDGAGLQLQQELGEMTEEQVKQQFEQWLQSSRSEQKWSSAMVKALDAVAQGYSIEELLPQMRVHERVTLLGAMGQMDRAWDQVAQLQQDAQQVDGELNEQLELAEFAFAQRLHRINDGFDCDGKTRARAEFAKRRFRLPTDQALRDWLDKRRQERFDRENAVRSVARDIVERANTWESEDITRTIEQQDDEWADWNPKLPFPALKRDELRFEMAEHGRAQTLFTKFAGVDFDDMVEQLPPLEHRLRETRSKAIRKMRFRNRHDTDRYPFQQKDQFGLLRRERKGIMGFQAFLSRGDLSQRKSLSEFAFDPRFMPQTVTPGSAWPSTLQVKLTTYLPEDLERATLRLVEEMGHLSRRRRMREPVRELLVTGVSTNTPAMKAAGTHRSEVLHHKLRVFVGAFLRQELLKDAQAAGKSENDELLAELDAQVAPLVANMSIERKGDCFWLTLPHSESEQSGQLGVTYRATRELLRRLHLDKQQRLRRFLELPVRECVPDNVMTAANQDHPLIAKYVDRGRDYRIDTEFDVDLDVARSASSVLGHYPRADTEQGRAMLDEAVDDARAQKRRGSGSLDTDLSDLLDAQDDELQQRIEQWLESNEAGASLRAQLGAAAGRRRFDRAVTAALERLIPQLQASVGPSLLSRDDVADESSLLPEFRYWLPSPAQRRHGAARVYHAKLAAARAAKLLTAQQKADVERQLMSLLSHEVAEALQRGEELTTGASEAMENAASEGHLLEMVGGTMAQSVRGHAELRQQLLQRLQEHRVISQEEADKLRASHSEEAFRAEENYVPQGSRDSMATDLLTDRMLGGGEFGDEVFDPQLQGHPFEQQFPGSTLTNDRQDTAFEEFSPRAQAHTRVDTAHVGYDEPSLDHDHIPRRSHADADPSGNQGEAHPVRVSWIESQIYGDENDDFSAVDDEADFTMLLERPEARYEATTRAFNPNMMFMKTNRRLKDFTMRRCYLSSPHVHAKFGKEHWELRYVRQSLTFENVPPEDREEITKMLRTLAGAQVAVNYKFTELL
ncbi:MAG: hypothetical protein MHM6MM_002654 [Cercozoa sp. M6MM]